MIEYWESIRPKDQAAPGLQWRPITKAIPGCVVAICPATGIIANYSNPTPDTPGGYTHYLDHSELAALPLMEPEPEPLAFPDPPHGWEWHNPENLTPEQVWVRDGWRLMAKGEPRHKGYQDYIGKYWTDGSRPELESGARLSDDITYRTKAPLPAPKPTPEEVERAEFETWAARPGIELDLRRLDFDNRPYIDNSTQQAFWAWKAAKKGASNV